MSRLHSAGNCWLRFSGVNCSWIVVCRILNTTKTNRRTDREQYTRSEECCDCQATYIGESGRNPSTWLTEHKRATRNDDVNNHIACDHLQTKHHIDSGLCDSLTLVSSKLRGWWIEQFRNRPISKTEGLEVSRRIIPVDFLNWNQHWYSL